MADKTTSSEMKPTLGLTGLTMNAMALIAPGAFLWLTFAIQGGHGQYRSVHVDRNCDRASALSGHRGLLCGTGEALSRHRQFLLLCRAVVSESRKGLEIRAAFEVHRRLGLASLLLDLSGRDGGRDGRALRLSGRHALAGLHERVQSRAHVHDAGRDRLLFRRWPRSRIAASTDRRPSTSPST